MHEAAPQPGGGAVVLGTEARDSAALFSWLLQPLPAAQFFEDHFEQSVCHVARRDADYYAELLSFDDIDRVINQRAVKASSIRLAKADSGLQERPKFMSDGGLDPAKLFSHYADGWSIILSQLDHHVPALGRLCQRLTLAFSSRFQTNIYVTPKSAAGFRAHYDTHDVFVLQVSGSKRWRTYAKRPVTLPLRSQPYQSELVGELGEVDKEWVLAPGDMLYLPRGVLHDAVSLDEPSLHITTGMLGYTWADLLLEAVAKQIMEDAQMRRLLPIGFATTGFARERAAETLQHHLQALVERTSLDGALSPFCRELISSHKRMLRGQLQLISELSDITETTPLRPRPDLLVALETDGEQVIVHVWDKEIGLPSYVEPALRAALTGPSTAQQLPDCVDAAGKLVLVRRLIKEGLLQRAD